MTVRVVVVVALALAVVCSVGVPAVVGSRGPLMAPRTVAIATPLASPNAAVAFGVAAPSTDAASSSSSSSLSSSSSSLAAAVADAVSAPLASSFQTAVKAAAAAAADPQICRQWIDQTTTCNCHECKCTTCYDCGCDWDWPWKSCSYDTCNQCSCGPPACTCCYTDNCARSCCSQCCEECKDRICQEWYTYSVTGVSPPSVSTTANALVTVTGGKYYADPNAQCRFELPGNRLTQPAFVVSANEVQCNFPPMSVAEWQANGGSATFPVEVSMDGGVSWTDNGVVVKAYQCPGQVGTTTPCNGHGQCLATTACLCDPGWWGVACDIECPGGAAHPCSGNGLYPDCNYDGTCNCANGFGGAACELACPESPPTPNAAPQPCGGSAHGKCLTVDGTCQCSGIWVGPACEHNRTCSGPSCSCEHGYWGDTCQNQCPGGVLTPCNDRGQCDDPTGACFCNDGYYGPACEHACIGSPATPGGPDVPCSGHGACSSVGDCQCDGGYYGPACNSTCLPSATSPCNGNAITGTCNDDGTCSCVHGYFGPVCGTACPGGPVSPCNGHGTCHSEYGTCTCDPGYAGAACELTCPGFAATGQACSGHGLCNSQTGTCSCVAGYYGLDCAQACPAGDSGKVCSDRGVCSAAGTCVCPGYWGPACRNPCPGDVTLNGHLLACSGNGLCDAATGACSCAMGYFGANCSGTCPGGAARPCNNNGTCDRVTGVCQCNSPWSGPDCSILGCVANCSGHGVCQIGRGVCVCDAGWSGPVCATNNPLPPPIGANPGFITFSQSSFLVREATFSLALTVQRLNGADGPVQARVRTVNVTAFSGLDFLAFDQWLYWQDQDTTTKTVVVTILEDALPEDAETLLVNISSVGGGARRGAIPTVTIVIGANDHGAPAVDELVEVQVRLNLSMATIPAGSSARAAFPGVLLGDLARALDIPVARLGFDSVVADPDFPATGMFVVFHFAPSTNPADPTPAQLALRLLDLVKYVAGRLYEGAVGRYFDPNYVPLFSSTTAPVPPPAETGGGGPNTVAIAVGVSVSLAVVLALVAVCYLKRKPLADWLLWKLGNFRFARFTEHDHHAGAGSSPRGAGGDGELTERPPPLAAAGMPAEQLTLAEPALNAHAGTGIVVPSLGGDGGSPTGAGGPGGDEHAKLTLSSDSERNNPGVGHETFDSLAPSSAAATGDPARDL